MGCRAGRVRTAQPRTRPCAGSCTSSSGSSPSCRSSTAAVNPRHEDRNRPVLGLHHPARARGPGGIGVRGTGPVEVVPMISLLISIVVLALVVTVLIWLIRYMGAPDILVKVVVVLAVLIALVMLLNAFGVLSGSGLRIRD